MRSFLDLARVVPAFALTALLLAMVPGQGIAMILRQSIIGGARAAYTSALGNGTGLLIWGASSGVGLSAIFARSQTAFTVLKWCGVGFLTFLSLQTLWSLRDRVGHFDLEGEAKTGFRSAYRLGLLTNLTNVKAAVFAVAFIPAFVPTGFSLGWGIFLLSCVQSVVSTSWSCTLIRLVKSSTHILSKPKVRRALTAVSATGIAFLAVGLALTSPR